MIPLELSTSTEESLILTLFDIANHLAKNGEAMAAQEGLTSQQWLMLLQIAGDPNFPTAPPRASRDGQGPTAKQPQAEAADGVLASEIAAARGVSRANVSTMITPLLRRKLIQQTDDPKDRRRKRLALTPAGRKIIERLEPLRRGANQKFFADLEPRVQRELLQHLQHCLDKLSQATNPRNPSASSRTPNRQPALHDEK